VKRLKHSSTVRAGRRGAITSLARSFKIASLRLAACSAWVSVGIPSGRRALALDLEAAR
jgi:hypothetical protein